MIQLRDVYEERMARYFLYQLLGERTAEESISHGSMPTFEEHSRFVTAAPYRAWYLIVNDTPAWVGAVHITELNSIGVAVMSEFRRRGYAREALQEVLRMHKPLPPMPSIRPARFVANINPANAGSIALFEGLGARHIQNSYELP